MALFLLGGCPADGGASLRAMEASLVGSVYYEKYYFEMPILQI
jgi:hypothetical protein